LTDQQWARLHGDMVYEWDFKLKLLKKAFTEAIIEAKRIIQEKE
jgi:hypothetical protein